MNGIQKLKNDKNRDDSLCSHGLFYMSLEFVDNVYAFTKTFSGF